MLSEAMLVLALFTQLWICIKTELPPKTRVLSAFWNIRWILPLFPQLWTYTKTELPRKRAFRKDNLTLIWPENPTHIHNVLHETRVLEMPSCCLWMLFFLQIFCALPTPCPKPSQYRISWNGSCALKSAFRHNGWDTYDSLKPWRKEETVIWHF